jgi:CheY-like chemotaxis protein/anti-sigma regulatory factor (Ser/Thr protein kinase)
MPEIRTLVVDDEAPIRQLLSFQLEHLGCKVTEAKDGQSALECIQSEPVDLIFTDIRMPRMSGLQLLQAVRMTAPETSVVVLSGFATVEDTVEALRLGALDFIHKPFEQEDVARAVERYWRLSREGNLTAELRSSLQESSRVFVIPSDHHAAGIVARSLTADLPGLGLGTPSERESVTLAVHEAILNAIIHGNLGVPSSLKNDEASKFEQLIVERQRDPAYGHRTVRIEYRADRTYAEYIVEDEGDGFDFRRLPDPSDSSALLEVSGRGLLIIRLTMNEVSWNERGNRIRLAWRPRRRPAGAAGAAAGDPADHSAL